MLTTERQSIIFDLLKEKQTVTIQEMIEATNASESTIRRDLTELEKKKMLSRIHGGATWTEQKIREMSILEKSTKNLQDKKRIAQHAASLVEDGDCIFLDAGTTTFQMIPFLQHKDIVVVTNGINLVERLMEHDIAAYLIGGKIKAKTSALVGSQAIESIKNYRFDKCFLGVNGFDLKFGYTTPDPEEASVKQHAANFAKKAYALADYSKLHKVNFAKIFDLDEAILITRNLPEEIKNELNAMKTVEVIHI
ncbi:lactose phosphotransferase system repressor [Oceanobacillus picturae]|uniref:Lactose phosphotransferase system repressor n=1 Tax=Oceanobacillus picturae TaxID=171693 RepID=A0A0U9H216_9BACI|nr:DeoR/GlpR family DNA-binding transcription regulator [Oceanobacillus picturae]GAQ16578.1 lactose phosphotransferase system repressor [Oceanobacillus picturae]